MAGPVQKNESPKHHLVFWYINFGFRASSGMTLTHQIQLLRSEVKTGVYRVAPAVALRKGEYALYLARGVGMAPYVYDFGVEENSSAVVATASEPKAAQERE